MLWGRCIGSICGKNCGLKVILVKFIKDYRG